jgi:hypothetical protein
VLDKQLLKYLQHAGREIEEALCLVYACHEQMLKGNQMAKKVAKKKTVKKTAMKKKAC